MCIRLATITDVASIHEIAHLTWWHTYQNILNDDQIEFMLDKMYSHESLRVQFEEGIIFLIAENDKGVSIAFASFSLVDHESRIFKIHKLYILPAEQGKGVGRKVLDCVKEFAITKGGKILELNVNKNNPAYNFYIKNGFHVFAEVDIPYYQYTLDDYVLRMPL